MYKVSVFCFIFKCTFITWNVFSVLRGVVLSKSTGTLGGWGLQVSPFLIGSVLAAFYL